MTGSTITGNTSKSIERHIGSSYKTILYVSKYLNKIKLISDNIESGVITDIHDNLGNIALVYANMDNVVTVAGISDDIVVVSNSANEVVAVGSNIDDVVRVRQSIDDVIRVSQSADNVDRIALSIDNLDRVFTSIDNIDTVVNHADDIDTVATNIAQVIATGNAIADVNTVAANIAYVLNVSNNMADVINASSFVDDIHTSVAAAALSEANALASAQAAETSNQESAANAALTSLDAASTAADKADVALMRDEVESDRAEVELNTTQVSIDAAQVSTDKGIVEGYKDESLAAKLLAQQWATGLSGSGVDVPSDTHNAYYFSEVARNNANQTFKSGGYFTPTVGQEYPDVTGVEVDTIWLIKFASASTSYTYTTGDLAGETLENGFMLVYDTPQNTFDFIPTTLTGANSINGVKPDATGNITLVASNISDVFSQTEVLAITNALTARVTTLEGSVATYNTVSDMVAGVPTKAKVGAKVATQGYYNNYVGGAVYRITTLVGYRNEINDSVWVPDGYGDHLLDNGLVAILHHNGTYWADQIGLHRQYDTPQGSLDAGVDHADDFNNMDAYLRKELSIHGTKGALILHVKGGSYYFNKTVWLPANVFLCGGSDWGAPHQPVKFVPLKPKYGGMIGNYHPLPNVPTLMDEFVPKTQAGGSGYLKLLNDWVSDGQGIIDVYYEFKRKELNNDTSEYGILGCEGKQTYLRSSGDKRRWICQFELNDGSIVKFAEEPPIRALEGKHRFERHADKLHWYILGSKIGEITVTDEITLNMFYNDYTMNRAFYGLVQYITLQTADFATNVYIEGYKRTPIDDTPTDLIIEGAQGNSAVLTNFTVGDEWKLKNKFNPNTREGFMFIWNSFPDSGGLKPEKSVYHSPYMGGMSSINVSNYEEDFDPENPYDKDYLKGISACMVYGGALFTHCEGNRIWTFAHRPEYESLDYYVDGWEVYNYKCNTPIENTHYQFDMNGTGDAVVFQGCQFPVNHPYADYPEGEYPNGVVKAIQMQNSAFYQGQWTLSTQSPNSGMQINRCINGQYALHGVEAFQVNACHLEFGQVWARDSAGSVNDTYFSQITEVGRLYPQYPDVVADEGQYPSSNRTLMLKNCHFHRGFDGVHLPLNDYNIVVSNVHTVEIDNCYQGWNYSGSGPIQIGVTVGRKEVTLDENETPSEVTLPLEGWSRWSHFLSNRASIVRGKIVPQTIVREIGGFGGIEDIFAIRSPTPLYWDIADDTTYYYQVQLLLDAGDQQTAEDPNWKPTGINPFIGYEEDGITPKETERSIYVPPASDSSWTRVLMNTYSQVRTLSQGVVRVYRGTASRNYTEYVDIPAMSLISMEDIGTTMYGRLWVPNPHAPDVAPINEAKNLDKFQIYMAGGNGFWESGAPQVQTGGISELIDFDLLQPQQFVLTSFRYFPNEEISGKTTNIYVSEDKDAGDLYVTLDANADVGTVVKVSGDFLSGVTDSVIVQIGDGVGVLGSFQSGGFLQAEKLGTETKSYWHATATIAGAPVP